MITLAYRFISFVMALLAYLGVSVGDIGMQTFKPYFNVSYGTGEAQVMDIFVPDSAYDREYNGVILYVHGGSWTGGDKLERIGDCTRLARNGYITATMNYTLRTEENGMTGLMMVDEIQMAVQKLKDFSDEKGLNISQRNITVSTCGIVPRMRQLAEQKLSITLALSLHASNQQKRLELMPVARAYDIHEVIDACHYYFEQTGRRVTFEYSLVKGVNDTETALVKGLNCHINLIPVNPIKERSYSQPDTRAVQGFKNKLEKNGINVTIRREMGRDIDGACGQLRKKYIDNTNDER